MFDTKIYHQLGCNCPGCHAPGCMCNYHMSHVFPYSLSQQIVEQNLYNKGYYEGRKEAYEELEHERTLLRNMGDQERFVKALTEAMIPLEELKKKLAE